MKKIVIVFSSLFFITVLLNIVISKKIIERNDEQWIEVLNEEIKERNVFVENNIKSLDFIRTSVTLLMLYKNNSTINDSIHEKQIKDTSYVLQDKADSLKVFLKNNYEVLTNSGK